VWNWLREPNSSRNLRAHGLGGATQKPDGKRPAALRKLSARGTTGARHGSCRRAIRPARDTEAVGAQYDQRATRKLSTRNTTGARHGSCRRAIRPARDTEAVGAQYDRRATRKLSARNTTGARYGSCRRTIRPAALLKLSVRGRTSASHAANSVLSESRAASASHATKSAFEANKRPAVHTQRARS
jgi:hypothetical protein